MLTQSGRNRSLLTYWPTYTTGSDMGDMGVQKGIRLGVNFCFTDNKITTCTSSILLVLFLYEMLHYSTVPYGYL